ncbi:MAG: ABC transporter permease [Phycisphaerales bacterium]|nr:ribose ABC transporter permease [Anaerolinea sp.]MBY0260917.1 ABC transporter permease [Phycisphaerales bacterium]
MDLGLSRLVRPRSLARSDAMQRLLAFAALILIIVFFSFASPNFFQFDNFVGILIATSVVGVLALGETFVIITAGIDLSIGTVMTLAAVMTGVVVTNMGLPVPVGVLAGILTGGLVGVANGILIARFKLPPFIATLGTLNVARGLALVISGLAPIYFTSTPEFNQAVMGSLLGSLIPGASIPNIVLVLFGAAIVAAFILSKTVLGRYTYALGSNEEATRLSGVNVAVWKTAVYALGGLFAGLGGVLIAARVNSAQPSLGFGYELDAIAAVVIGGTSLSGGEGSILGTIIGAFIISTLTNGLRIMSVPQEWQTVVTGVVVILAVYLDIIRRRQQA